MTVERVGVSFEPELLEKFDALIQKKGYTNRSEAIRDLVRETIVKSETSVPGGSGIGTITILYDHDAGDVTNKLLHLQHGVLHSHGHEPSGRHSHEHEPSGRRFPAETDKEASTHPHPHNSGAEILATTHIHVDEHDCLEVLAVRGECARITELADSIRAIKGVKHGELVLTKADL